MRFAADAKGVERLALNSAALGRFKSGEYHVHFGDISHRDILSPESIPMVLEVVV